MVYHHQRYNQLKKTGDEEAGTLVFVLTNPGHYRRRRPKLFSIILLSLLSCTIILAPQFFTFPSTLSQLYSFGVQNEDLANTPLCSSISNGSICCDRSHFRTDVCFMKGDIRTHSPTSSVFLYSEEDDGIRHEKIKPYTRKWETSVMNTIDELELVSKRGDSGVDHHRCDVIHDVPAVFFSTGGYTGNVYHEFNDGIIPLYITSERFNKKVVFVILEYHEWWVMKYGDILSHLSDYPPIDFSGDNRTHCFPEAIAGLRIHDELTVDPSLMQNNKSIADFRQLIDRAYRPRITSLVQHKAIDTGKKEQYRPKLVILSRNGSRAITNENVLVKTAEQIGFQVRVVRPQRTTELAKIYMELNSSDVMIGVHGAAMTHSLFMRPACSVFIQVIPLGTDWAAETYYGEPAKKLGLKYIGYKIMAKESSLFHEYDRNDPVLRDPDSLNQRGWEYTKKIYLERQTVKLNIPRFRKRLVRAYDHINRIHRKSDLR